MEHDLEVARQEREELEKINEELHRQIFQMEEKDRKKQQTIKQYQEQNRNMVLSKQAMGSRSPELRTMSDLPMSSDEEEVGDDSNAPPITKEEITKLNASMTQQPQNYQQYSHADNPNNPFSDNDSDSSDWGDVDTDDADSEDHFEITATNKRGLNQSLAAIEKKLHLEQGLQALVLREEEIEKLKRTHYDGQATLDRIKSLERNIEREQRTKNDTKLQMVIEEEFEPEGSPCDMDGFSDLGMISTDLPNHDMT